MKASLLITLLLLAWVTPGRAADLLIVNNIDGYAPDMTTLSEGLPGTDGLVPYIGSGLTYRGAEDTVRVEVREYADASWLAHNVEGQLRHTAGGGRLGELSETAVVADGGALCLNGVDSRCWWVNGSRVVAVSGGAPQQVMSAYLKSLPPTASAFTADDAWAHDEMARLLDGARRRLELSAQSGERDQLPWINRELGTFLQYRDKYYGVAATDERLQLSKALQEQDDALLHSKLAEYQDWLEHR